MNSAVGEVDQAQQARFLSSVLERSIERSIVDMDLAPCLTEAPA